MFYITVEELNTLMPSIFLSSELLEVKWKEVPDSDKNALISRAEGVIDCERFMGSYVEPYQEHAFPRIICNRTVSEQQTCIKQAICYIIYDILSYKQNGRAGLIKQGVKSISTGGVSESYAENVKEITDKYKVFLKKYLFNGVL